MADTASVSTPSTDVAFMSHTSDVLTPLFDGPTRVGVTENKINPVESIRGFNHALKAELAESPPKRGTMLDIFRIRSLRNRTFIISFAWFGTSLMCYGLSLNVGSFGLDIYLTQLIFGAVELPARLGSLLLFQRLGRNIGQAAVLFFGGAACVSMVLIPKEMFTFCPSDLPVVVTVIAVLGKFAATSSFSTVCVYSAELYPTTLRLLEVYHYIIPMLISGIIPVCGGALCLFLPETLNVELQDHMELRDCKRENSEEQRFVTA